MTQSKLQRDLEELMWFNRGTAPFIKELTSAEWFELTKWCDSNFGKQNWFIEKNKIHTRKAEHITLFLLKWS
jgi:hypothetical protein